MRFLGYDKEYYNKNKSKYKKYFKKYYQKNKIKLKEIYKNKYNENKDINLKSNQYVMKVNSFKSRRQNTLKHVESKINYEDNYTFEDLMNIFLYNKEDMIK